MQESRAKQSGLLTYVPHFLILFTSSTPNPLPLAAGHDVRELLEELRGGIAKLHKVINCNQKQTCPAAEVGAQRKRKGHTPRRLTRVDPLLPPGTISRRSPAERLEVERDAIHRGCFSSSSQMSDSSSRLSWCTTISLSICRVSRILSPEGLCKEKLLPLARIHSEK